MNAVAVVTTLLAFLVGALVSRKLFARTFPTTQEQLDILAAIATPAQAEALIELSKGRFILTLGSYELPVKGYYLHFDAGDGTKVESPARKDLALLLEDVELFQRRVAALTETK